MNTFIFKKTKRYFKQLHLSRFDSIKGWVKILGAQKKAIKNFFKKTRYQLKNNLFIWETTYSFFVQ